ncbi:EAL domain-containing protein [Methylopila sp. M107]|uniref:EAL domain-containing protein n=1 Tax=Methylopila sp. M107 TaxID=1101190 RepID=UPI0003755B8B|nr:EAL domain-containing protein [Methylopila sp. M107]
MTKPAAIFVAAAMAVTAGCVSVIATYGLGLNLPQALLCGFASLAGMAVTQLAFTRAAPQESGRLDDLDHVVNELQSRLEMIDLRLSTLDGAASERARAATKPVVEEIAALGGLVTSIAREVAGHDVELSKLKAAARPMATEGVGALAPQWAQPAAPAFVQSAPPAAPALLRTPEPFDPGDAIGRRDAFAETPGDLDRRIVQALASGRIEPHLQPIVTLPSRRVSHYEALARLIEADSQLTAEQFLPAAVANGRMAEIDRRILEGAAPVALRLASKGGGAVFVNVAPETFATAEGRAGIAAPFDGRLDFGRMMVLEMPQAGFGSLGGEALALLQRLTGAGVRLSLDHVEDLRLDARDLARRGVRFVKVSAERLLDPEAARGAAIHPADLSGLLSRNGVELIATHVEDERTVPELLDMDVRFAQGALFGVPRPVRPAAPDAPLDPPAARPAAARLVPRAVAAR